VSRVLYMGKYPPLQGGTSVQGLWLVGALARAGCNIDVISSGEIGGARYTCAFTKMDWQVLATFFPEFLQVQRFELATEDPYSSYSIPETDAYVTRLVALALERAEVMRPDFIIAHYLEPFGVAASLVSEIMGVPYAIIHAGSDITRLSLLPSRRTAYRSVLTGASVVLSARSAGHLATAMGTPPDRLLTDRPSLTPTNVFTDLAEPLDPAALQDCWRAEGLPHRVYGAAPPPDRRAVLCVGKVDERKGTFDLVRALARLHAEKRPCPHLVFVTEQGSPMFERLRALVAASDLGGQVSFLPFLPQWRLKDVFAASRAVAFLENQFPVAIHRPQVPREAAAAGLALILSAEVARYQRSTRPVVAGRDAIIINDPTKTDDVADALALVASDDTTVTQLADAASTLYRWPSTEQKDRWVREFLDLMTTSNQVRRLAAVSVDEFNSSLIRLFADRAYRASAQSNVGALEPANLTETERDTLRAVLADHVTLERYCSSLMHKKYAFLSRYFRDAFEQAPDCEAAVRKAFLEHWVLQELPLADEIMRFRDFVLNRMSVQADDRQTLRATIVLAAAQARALFVDVDEVVPIDWMNESITIRITSHSQFVETPTRPHQSAREATNERWTAIVFPDLLEFIARTFEVSPDLLDLLRPLHQTTPLSEVVAKLQQLSGGAPMERIRALIDRLGAMGVLTAA
jgi:glycosyltransferase involved in cell wall biosynthesis